MCTDHVHVRSHPCPIAGLVFICCSEPYLQSEYGSNYITDSPVKLLDALLFGHREHEDEQAGATAALQCHPSHQPLCSAIHGTRFHDLSAL